MTDLSSLGRWVVVLGLIIMAVGTVIWATGKLPWLGRLPGDFRVEGEHFKFYFPLATCILISVVVSLILWILSKFK